jgi:hypothetical protein
LKKLSLKKDERVSDDSNTRIVDLVPTEVPSPQPLSFLTFRSRPRVPIRQRAENREIPDGDNYEHGRDLETPARTERRRDEIEYSAK